MLHRPLLFGVQVLVCDLSSPELYEHFYFLSPLLSLSVSLILLLFLNNP